MSVDQQSDGAGSEGQAAGLSAGRRLAQAREKKGLSIDKVARELRLDSTIVQAMENDDREALPAPIFVQGYMRSYARLMGLPEDEIALDYTRANRNLPPLNVIRVRTPRRMMAYPSLRLLRNLVALVALVAAVWLAYPHVVRLFDSTTEEPAGENSTGRLELPPAGRQ